MRSFTLIASLALAALAAAALASGPGVVTLTDSTFEHTTQAATGQTTGRWCVNVCKAYAATTMGTRGRPSLSPPSPH